MDGQRYYTISVVTRDDLARRRYRMDEVITKEGASAFAMLLQNKKKDLLTWEEASQLQAEAEVESNLQVESEPASPSLQSESLPNPLIDEAAPVDPDAVQDVSEEKPKQAEDGKKKKMRRLKKPNLSLFEEIVDKKAILEKEVVAKINQDGYYDGVQPYDVQMEVSQQKTKKKKDMSVVLILVMAIIVLLGILVYMIGDLFL